MWHKNSLYKNRISAERISPTYNNLLIMGGQKVDHKCSVCCNEEKRYTRISIDQSKNTSTLSKKFYDLILILFDGNFPHPSEVVLCQNHMRHVESLATSYSKVIIRCKVWNVIWIVE